MPQFQPDTKRVKVEGEYVHAAISNEDISKFTPEILGLGDISRDGRARDVIAVIFDLQGFTSFCNQLDPQLVVPEYLSKFLNWLFDTLRTNFTKEEQTDITILWGGLPFYAKFMGDGVLFLWDTKGLSNNGIGNVVIQLIKTCQEYVNKFYVEAQRKFSEVPPRLRCGVARGQVIPVGNGEDFVGPCINMAARLQKLGNLSFVVSRRGFDPEGYLHQSWAKNFVVKKTSIRGISQNELVCIFKTEFDTLTEADMDLFD